MRKHLIQFYVHLIMDGCSCRVIKPVPVVSFPLSSVGKLGEGLKTSLHFVYVHMCKIEYGTENSGAIKLLGSGDSYD